VLPLQTVTSKYREEIEDNEEEEVEQVLAEHKKVISWRA